MLALSMVAAASAHGAIIDITSHGAVPSVRSVYKSNTAAINAALAAATAGDTVLVPEGAEFYAMGGIGSDRLDGVTLRIDGTLHAVPDYQSWPTTDPENPHTYRHFIHVQNSTGFTVTSASTPGSGVVDGAGQVWWARYTVGECGFDLFKNKTKYCPKRPKLLVCSECSHLLVEKLDQVRYAEVREVTVNTDINVTRALRQELRSLRDELELTDQGRAGRAGNGGLQPEDLNTDGIDPAGHDVWIHDCIINNDDDSIAVKPSDATSPFGPCSENMLIENMVITGMGTSIGSVPPHPNHNCVRNITFRNITMPKTGKGVYIKSNPECLPGKTAEITNIVYEDILMEEPEWWAIWIGPQQQHEPNSALGDKCSLDYPIDKSCPTQGCVTFANITLRNIHVTKPWLSPGVILGNATNPMKGLVFDNVVFDMGGSDTKFPFGLKYQCENAEIAAIGGTYPVPTC